MRQQNASIVVLLIMCFPATRVAAQETGAAGGSLPECPMPVRPLQATDGMPSVPLAGAGSTPCR